MTKPRFDSTITLGSLLTIVSMVCVGAAAWGVHTTTLATLEGRLTRLDIITEAHEKRLRESEVSAAVERQKMDSILISLDEIKGELRRLNHPRPQ